MKKKVLALFLCFCVSLAALGGCGGKADTNAEAVVSESASEESGSAYQGGAASDRIVDAGDAKIVNSGTVTYIPTIEGSEVTIGIKSDPKTFGPFSGGGAGRIMTNLTVYEGLGYQNVKGFESCMLKSYENTEENVWDFEIYDNIYDTAGNHITAEDVVFSWMTCKELGNRSSFTAALDYIEATGDYTCRVHMIEDRIDSFYSMCEWIMIVSQKAYEDSGDEMATWPVGTAPYELVEYVAGDHMTYKCTGNYWNEENPDQWCYFSAHNIETIKYLFITDDSQHAIALQTGTIDSTNKILAADYNLFLEDDGETPKEGYSYVESFKPGPLTMLYNCGDSVCADPALRKAIAYGVDRSALAYAAYSETGIAMTSFSQPMFLDYSATDYTPKDGYYGYNVELAKKQLEESGYNGEEIQLYCSTDTEVTSQAELIRTYCEAIGIKIQVTALDPTLLESTMYTYEPGWDIALIFGDSGSYTYANVANFIDRAAFDGEINAVYVNDDTLQELFDTAVAAKTYSLENTQAFFDYVYEQCYLLPLTDYQFKLFYNSDKIETFATMRDGMDEIPGGFVPAGYDGEVYKVE